MNFLLRVEAVNFNYSILDTNDLSTIRGGGLRALECAEKLSAPGGLKSIYTGASQGLFELKTESLQLAEQRRDQILTQLRSDFPEQTFTVEVAECKPGNFKETVDQLRAASRWSQMQSPSLVYPGSGTLGVCKFDRIRPATTTTKRKGAAYVDENLKDRLISEHSLSRRAYGIGEKHHKFYETHAMRGEDEEFVNDFDQLSDRPDAGRLHHKIAVIYLDGNKFSSRFSKFTEATDYTAFSDLLKANANSFLTEMIKQVTPSPDHDLKLGPWTWSGEVVTNNDQPLPKRNALRLETLLWGGDEIIWVVPAWQGWWWLQQFFSLYGKTPAWQGTQTSAIHKDKPLTFGGGIVFCHHNSPIHDATRLARNLADQPKKRETENTFAYQILESFDHLGHKPMRYRNSQLPGALVTSPNSDSPYLTLPDEAMSAIAGWAHILKQKLPRSHIHEIVLNLCQRKDLPAASKTAQSTLSQNSATEDFLAFTRAIFPESEDPDETNRQHAAWIHLNNLWDYFPAPSTGAAQ